MLDAHAHVMQVKLCKAKTRGVTVLPILAEQSSEVTSMATAGPCACGRHFYAHVVAEPASMPAQSRVSASEQTKPEL